jgi:hypothetical protein
MFFSASPWRTKYTMRVPAAPPDDDDAGEEDA